MFYCCSIDFVLQFSMYILFFWLFTESSSNYFLFTRNITLTGRRKGGIWIQLYKLMMPSIQLYGDPSCWCSSSVLEFTSPSDRKYSRLQKSDFGSRTRSDYYLRERKRETVLLHHSKLLPPLWQQLPA